MITFYALTESYGCPTQIAEVFTEEEFFSGEPPANRIRECITVADQEAIDRWLAAKNRWLAAAWEPNQYDNHHGEVDPSAVLAENARIRQEAEEEMESLEV